MKRLQEVEESFPNNSYKFIMVICTNLMTSKLSKYVNKAVNIYLVPTTVI